MVWNTTGIMFDFGRFREGRYGTYGYAYAPTPGRYRAWGRRHQREGELVSPLPRLCGHEHTDLDEAGRCSIRMVVTWARNRRLDQ